MTRIRTTSAHAIASEAQAVPYEFERDGRHGIARETWRETVGEIIRRGWPRGLLPSGLSKWLLDNLVPVFLLFVVLATLSLSIPDFFSEGNLLSSLRQVGEYGLTTLGMLVVVAVGGIDLSVGAIYALCNFVALLLVQYLGWPVGVAIPAAILAGAALGLFNGFLIGYLGLRAFLTTLISIVIFRAIYEILASTYGAAITAIMPDSDFWTFLASGQILGIGLPFWLCLAFAVVVHIVLTRLRVGWHIMAIGGSRRAAHNAGIPVAPTIMLCYAASGALTAVSSLFAAAQLGDLGFTVGIGIEVKVLTGIIAGGVALGGGKGSVLRALIGILIVMLLINGLTQMSFQAGIVSISLALLLIFAALFENVLSASRQGAGSAARLIMGYFKLPSAPVVRDNLGGVWQRNDRLAQAEVLGLGCVDRPDDVIFDRLGDLLVSSGQGDVQALSGPKREQSRILAHVGGATMGLAFDAAGSLYVCAGEMGLYRVSTDGAVERATNETHRRAFSLSDDARLRFVDDLDIAPDGRVFFSENGHWLDLIRAQGDGRVLCYDPVHKTTRTVLRGLHFPNGVSMGPDGQSIFVALTTECGVLRHWFDGPNAGRTEMVLSNLPAHPGNINPASDGHYWMALLGGRSPAIDLAWRMPGFRKRMSLQLQQDEWPGPQFNAGGVLKFTADGKVLDVLWDASGDRFPMVTSVREHEGYLYLGAGGNNKFGRIKITEDCCDPRYNQVRRQWPQSST
jgi:ribose transport system permease protein